MNVGLLQRLFMANQMPQTQAANGLTLEQEPGDLWAPKSRANGDTIDLAQPQVSDPGAMEGRMNSLNGVNPWPQDAYYLDRVEGDEQDGDAMGVLMDPYGGTSNVPGSMLDGSREGDYIPGGRLGPLQGPTPSGGPLQRMWMEGGIPANNTGRPPIR